MADTLYTTQQVATGGRAGRAQTMDGRLSVELTPPTLPNRPATGTDPEQLFGCGYAACYGGAVEFVAKQRGASLMSPVKVTSEVSLLRTSSDPVQFGIAVSLLVELEGVTQEMGEEICATAHTVCPYSNAIRGNIEVATTVRAKAAAA